MSFLSKQLRSVTKRIKANPFNPIPEVGTPLEKLVFDSKSLPSILNIDPIATAIGKALTKTPTKVAPVAAAAAVVPSLPTPCPAGSTRYTGASGRTYCITNAGKPFVASQTPDAPQVIDLSRDYGNLRADPTYLPSSYAGLASAGGVELPGQETEGSGFGILELGAVALVAGGGFWLYRKRQGKAS